MFSRAFFVLLVSFHSTSWEKDEQTRGKSKKMRTEGPACRACVATPDTLRLVDNPLAKHSLNTSLVISLKKSNSIVFDSSSGMPCPPSSHTAVFWYGKEDNSARRLGCTVEVCLNAGILLPRLYEAQRSNICLNECSESTSPSIQQYTTKEFSIR